MDTTAARGVYSRHLWVLTTGAMVGCVVILGDSRCRNLSVCSAAGRPLFPHAFEELARNILRFIVSLTQPPGPEIDTYAAGENEDDASDTLESVRSTELQQRDRAKRGG